MSDLTIVTGKGFTTDRIEATAGALTLYVRTGGADTNDGLTSGNAFLTIQAAINRVPKNIGHTVAIDVGVGTFDGGHVAGFKKSDGNPSFGITGTLDSPTLASGTATGTATGGNTLQLIDAGQGWTGDDLIGHFLRVDSETRAIYANDGTNIYVVSAFTLTTSGKTYEILEPKTIIDTEEAVESAAGFVSRGNALGIDISDFEFDTIAVGVLSANTEFGASLERCRFTACTSSGLSALDTLQGVSVIHCSAMSCAIGYAVSGSIIGSMTGCLAYDSTSYGVYLSNLTNISDLGDIVALANADHGLYVTQGVSDGLTCDRLISTDNTGAGLRLEQTNGLVVVGTDSVLSTNSRYGIELDSNDTSDASEQTELSIVGDLTISDNVLGGIIANNRSVITMSNTNGTGNGGYGLRTDNGSKAIVTSATSITGTTGDTTVNTGNTIFAWTHLVDDGDIIRNFESGSQIERRD